MNFAHLHLLANHAPLFGVVLSLPLLAHAMARRHEASWRASAYLLMAAGAGAALAWASGDGAEKFLATAGLNLDVAAIHEHEERAEVAGVLTIAVGVSAGLGWVRYDQWKRTIVPLTFVLALGALASLIWTANAGGAIRHPEETTVSG